MFTQTIPHWLTKQAQVAPDKIAIETDYEMLTFSKLKEKSELLARKIATFNVNKHSRVAILSNNCMEMIFTIHALSYLQATIVFLNTRLTTNELTYQIEEAKVEFIITTEELRNEKRLPYEKIKTYAEIDNTEPTEVLLQTDINLNEPFTMMFTSGTTGKPKAVLHTYGNHWWSAIGSVLNLGLAEKDKWLLTLPMFHVGGFSIVMRSVIYGMTIFLLEKYEKYALYDALKNKDITIVSLVTLMLRELLEVLGDEPFPKQVRTVLLGGGSVPTSLLDIVVEKQIPLFQSYGMTETSSQIVTLSAQDALRKLGSSGKALLPAEVKIEDKNEAGVGEIWVRGPMVINGYQNNEKANRESFINGWLKTGDLGYFDDEGFLYVLDRRTDLIISAGENIYPAEVESALLSLNEVKDAAVVPLEDEKWGQVPVACIVWSNGKSLTKASILNHLQSRLARYKIPRRIFVTDVLPRNASNKIMRHRIRDFIKAGKFIELDDD